VHSRRHTCTQTNSNTTVLQQSVIHKQVQTSLCTHTDIHAHRQTIILLCYNSQSYRNTCRHWCVLVHTQTHSNTTMLQQSVIHKHLQTLVCTGTHRYTQRHTVILRCYNSQSHINTCRHRCALTHKYTHTDTQ